MKPWQVVFRKEFFEVFRDGRTRFNIILSPLLITPLLIAGLLSMTERQTKEQRRETITAAVVGLDKAPTLRELLRDSEKEEAVDPIQGAGRDSARVRLVDMSLAEAESAVRERRVRSAAVIPPDAEELMKAARPVPIQLLVDQGSQSSQEGAQRLRRLLDARGRLVVMERLAENGLSMTVIRPFAPTERAIKGGKEAGTALLAMFLPYILALSAIMGGIYLANDSVAGEKERGTLETLLVSPASRRDLAFGKFLAVGGVSLVSGVLSLVGFLWPFYIRLPFFDMMARLKLTLSPTAIAAMLLVQIPLAILGAGLLLSISTFARNQKEAQTYLGPLILAASVAAMMSMMVKAEAPLFWAAVPITNAALVLKQALEGVTNLPFAILACVTSITYAAAAVWFATHSFQKESILLKA